MKDALIMFLAVALGIHLYSIGRDRKRTICNADRHVPGWDCARLSMPFYRANSHAVGLAFVLCA